MKQWILFVIFIFVVLVVSLVGLTVVYAAAIIAPKVLASPKGPQVADMGPAIGYGWKADQIQTGEELDFRDYRGEVVVLNFWASWCGYSLMQMPSLERLHLDMEPQGLRVLCVASGDDAPAAIEYVESGRFAMPTGVIKSKLPSEYEIEAFPTTLVLNRDGLVVLRITGCYTDWDSEDMQRQLRRLLNAPAAK